MIDTVAMKTIFDQTKRKIRPAFCRLFAWLYAAFAACGLAGCAAPQTYTPAEAPEMVVVKDFAPFYSIGPQQMQGPDVSLRLEERLKLLRREFGYSYVQLDDGRTGFIPNENIAPAPPRPAFSGSTDAGTGRGGNRSFTPYSGPPVDDIPLPDLEVSPVDIPPPVLLDDVEPEKKPQFRL
jgi:hypothetical protein